jgi:predicted DNA-binding transcriptional regulator AlpA
VARLVRVTPQTLRTWVKDKNSSFPKPLQISDKTVRYDLDEVEAWLRARAWARRMLDAPEATGA